MLYLVGILIAVATGLFLYGLGRMLEPTAEMDERIGAWLSSHRASGAKPENGSPAFLERVERGIARQNFGEQIATDLARADLAITVSEYIFVRAALVVVGLLTGYMIQHNLIASLTLGLAGFFLPVFYLRTRQGRRLRAFDAQLPDVLDHLVGSLRAGYGMLQAVEWVGRQVASPAGAEFERIIREVQLGRSLTDALDGAVRRIDSDDLALIVTAVKIQHEVGGSLAEILATVAETIRERVRIQREIGVLTAQQRYSGYVLMIMPIALAFILFLLNPEYESQLFAPGPTLCIPITTIIMMVIGFFVMRRIVDINV
jgi:tight adherence protein B